jgi:hypothetical protein
MLGREIGTFPTLTMYYLNLNCIFIINVDIMAVVKRNLKDSPSHKQMTTFGVTFALSKVFRNDF